jgi:hypothetical protein
MPNHTLYAVYSALEAFLYYACFIPEPLLNFVKYFGARIFLYSALERNLNST